MTRSIQLNICITFLLLNVTIIPFSSAANLAKNSQNHLSRSHLIDSQKPSGGITLLESTSSENATTNLSYNDLLQFEVESFDACVDPSSSEELIHRFEAFIEFFGSNPSKALQNSIAALTKASKLLQKALDTLTPQSLLETNDSNSLLLQTNKNKKSQIAKQHSFLQNQNKKQQPFSNESPSPSSALKEINKVNPLLNPSLFTEISDYLQAPQPTDLNEFKTSLAEVIKIIGELKEQHEELLAQSDSFDSFVNQLSKKHEQFSLSIEVCSS